jgi:hypothetical protein
MPEFYGLIVTYSIFNTAQVFGVEPESTRCEEGKGKKGELK